MQRIMDMHMQRTRMQPKRMHTTTIWHNTEVYLGYLNITDMVQGKYEKNQIFNINNDIW